MKAKLNSLGPDGFEHLIQALATAQYGDEVKIYGDGPDGQREAMIDCPLYDTYLFDQPIGKTIIQAKFKSPDGKADEYDWLRTNIKKEMDSFKKKAIERPDLIPKTWIFYTNLILTAVQDTGLYDKADQYVREINEAFQKEHGHKLIENVYLHGADKIRSILDNYPGIYERYFGQLRNLRMYLQDYLCRIRAEHPSFKLIQPDKVDERLIPGVEEVLSSEPIGKLSNNHKTGSVWSLIMESWKEQDNLSIIIEGSGGIGKTVTLLSPPKELSTPALYLHLYDLIDRDSILSLSEYMNRYLFMWAKEIDALCAAPWNKGPTLLLLLDGFNEIPVMKRRDVLRNLNQWHLTHPGAQIIIVSRPLDGINLKKRNLIFLKESS